MKSVLLLPLILASASVTPTPHARSRVELGGRFYAELVNPGGSPVTVVARNEKEGQIVYVATKGEGISLHFREAKFANMFSEHQSDTTKTTLVDEDGDGLPNLRRTYTVLADGGFKLSKVEEFTWTAKEVPLSVVRAARKP